MTYNQILEKKIDSKLIKELIPMYILYNTKENMIVYNFKNYSQTKEYYGSHD